MIRKKGLQVKSTGEFGLTFEHSEGITACFLKSGIMVAQTPPQLDDDIAIEVLDIYKSILIDGMGLAEDIMPDMD